MHALRQELLSASGVEFATSLNLTPATLASPSSTRRVLSNVVVARSNLIRIFEVREELSSSEDGSEAALRAQASESVAGEADLDRHSEGWINQAQYASQDSAARFPTVTKLYLLRRHRVHGIVTGTAAVKIAASSEDKLDRLLISFKDAKIALMEWDEAIHDLVTISIHTYERAPQVTLSHAPDFRAVLRVDTLSRCAALSLPQDALAILPFYQTATELDVVMDQEQPQHREIPYTPSFILDLSSQVDQSIRHVIDYCFLPGFTNPTIAVLFQTQQTWTGRLKEFKDTVSLIIFTVDLVTHRYPVISTVNGLPHDCLSLLACSESVGGALVISTNAVIYVDQSTRRVVLPVNGWLPRISDIPHLTPISSNIQLDGCRAQLVDDRTVYLFLVDGSVYPVEIATEGRTVTKLVMASEPLAQTTVPAEVIKIGGQHLFIGSTVGPSALVQMTTVQEDMEEEPVDVEMQTTEEPQEEAKMEEDDDDEDIYGPSTTTSQPATNGHVNGATGPLKKTRTVTRLSLCDALLAHGTVADMAFSMTRNGDRTVPELVAATGSGSLGGFTLFQRDLPCRVKRKMHAIGGARGMWSLHLKQSKATSSHSQHLDYDNLIVSTDASPSPGLSRIANRSSRSDIIINTRIPGTTVGAGTFFQKTAILHVMTNAIRVLEPDGTERQVIKDVDGNTPRAKIRACSICDPFVLVIREDDSIGLFIETDRGRVRRKDMSAMGDKSSRYIAGCFFTDSQSLFDVVGVESTDQATLSSAMSSGTATQWLVLVRPQGIVEIWTLPKLVLVFSTPLIATLDSVITDTHDEAAQSLPQDPPRKPQPFDIDQIVVAPLGETCPEPHLFVYLRSGQMAIYKTIPWKAVDDAIVPRSSGLGIRFVKVFSKSFEIQPHESEINEKSILAEQKRISRHFVPFTTDQYSGVFFTGDFPSWILATDRGGINVFSSGHTVVHSFTMCSLWESKNDFLLYSDEGPALVEWLPGFNLDYALPSRSIHCGRSYSNVLFDSGTSLLVAASTLQSKFASFDEDDVKIWSVDGPNISDPTCESSTLELISPDPWLIMDGYEFATNEFVNAVERVTLETAGTETGSKEFIAVGTTINRGEDLAVKGATYIFEIAEVVPDLSVSARRWYKLRLRFRDDSKGPVTALSGFNGYLVSSMGQKIFVRAFDSDERLVGIAFLDVGIYVTSLRTLKNLLLIGDAVKSVWFVAFQEDPFKLVILAKDIHPHCVTSVDFFFSQNQLSIVTGGEDGVIRVYDHDPTDPDSRNGQILIPRTEFNAQVEYRTSTLIARRTKEDSVVPQARLILGHTDGSISSLTAVDEHMAKRLQLLQGQLTRNIQHVAGLNPRALRTVRNDFFSKPLSKGIFDGNLLEHFQSLSQSQQREITRQIGTEPENTLRDWTSLVGVW